MRAFAMIWAVAAALAAGTIVAVASAGGSSPATTIHLFEHDTSQANVDLGAAGDSAGDEFVFAGDAFDRKGGTNLGRFVGTFTTASTGPDAEVLAVATFELHGGQIAVQGRFAVGPLFAGRRLAFAITGGTSAYRHARGEGSVALLGDMTDADFVLRLR
ncbi:MAG: hypothetical protein QOJ35_1547 [Solirubrobacteraceae bacterium]|jgi:hypothetical protein|nr:hypothetical protein [Solirubrobacteraceae bacterium]